MSSILRDSPEIIPAGGVANEFNQCGGVGGAVPSVAAAGEKQKTRKFSIIEGENVPKKGRKEELITDLNGNEVPLVNKTKPNGKIVDQEMTKPKTNKPKWAHYLKKWVAPEWVPKNIPTLPKSKVKERVKNPKVLSFLTQIRSKLAYSESISSGKVLSLYLN